MTSFFSFGKNKNKDSQFLFNNWISTIIENESPDSSINAINFGIFESEDGYKLYFAGFKFYDNENDDWAEGLGDFIPKNNYFQLPKEEFKKLEFELVQQKVVKLIENFITTDLYKKSFLFNIRTITTGFDDGDLIKIK